LDTSFIRVDVAVGLHKKAIEQLEKRLQKAEKDSAFLENKFKETFREKEKLLRERDEHKNKLQAWRNEFPEDQLRYLFGNRKAWRLIEDWLKRFGALVGE
jgi:predicted  nucleic acid-binding Zn-ribbon protein